jgi:hypothetical protein
MIQTKNEVSYGVRSYKSGKIKITIDKSVINPDGVVYTVSDWDITENNSLAINSKEVFYSNEKINALDNYLEANTDFSLMNRTEKEYKKLAMALMLDTQTNLLPSGKTIYGLTPNDWEFTPEE